MNPYSEVYCSIKLNGKIQIIEDNMVAHVRLKQVPLILGRLILNTQMEHRDFSSLELRLSKRPITWDSQEEDDPLLKLTQFVKDDDILLHGEPGEDSITYAEFNEVSRDPIWQRYCGLKNARVAEETTASERDQIVSEWKTKYARTKFARLI